MQRLSIAALLGMLLAAFAALADGARAGERGKLFLQSWEPDDYGGNQQSWDVAQDHRGIVYVANSDGLLEFDGSRWRFVENPRQLRFWSLATAEDGTVYAGASGDLGYLAAGPGGVQRFVSLLDRVPEEQREFGEIRQVISAPEGIYFRERKDRIFRWRPRDGEIDVWNRESEGNTALFLSRVGGRLLLAQRDVGIEELHAGGFQPLAGSEVFAPNFVTAMLPLAENILLVLTFRDGLHLHEQGTVTPWETEASAYAREHLGRAAGRLADGRFALSTLRGGLALFDRSGELLRVIDGAAGLPDNGVLNRGVEDAQGGLWLPLNNGIARVEVASPFDLFDGDLGLDGSVTAVHRFRGTLYVGSNRGLYTLEPAAAASMARLAPVAGIKQECWMLREVEGRLLVAASDGLFEIAAPGRPPQVLCDHVVLSLASGDDGVLYEGTHNQGLQRLNLEQGRWTHKGRIEGTSNDVRAIVEDPEHRGRLWLRAITPQRVERIERVELETGEVRLYSIDQGLPLRDELHPFRWRGLPYVGGDTALYRYRAEDDRFVPEVGPGEGAAAFHPSVDGRGRLWLFQDLGRAARATVGDDGAWRLDSPLTRVRARTFWTFYPEGDGELVWIGADAGRLLRWNETRVRPEETPSRALVRRVSVARAGGEVLFAGTPSPAWSPPALAYASNSLRFEFALPRFDAPETNQLQSRLVGQDEAWSEWSSETYRDFTALWEGDYRFEVRGRDVHGKISEPAAFELRVLPPWYRTPWAYAAYLLALAGLFCAAVAWQQRHSRRRMGRLEREIVERRRINRELEQANSRLRDTERERERFVDELESRNAEMERFIYTVSHDLKSPLITIRGFLGMLERDAAAGDADRMRDDMARIHAAAGKMAQLLDELLELSRIGRVLNTPTQARLDVLVRQAVEQVAGRIAERGVEVEIAADLPPVYGDQPRLIEVLQNLIENAVKFLGDQPRPRIEIGWRPGRGRPGRGRRGGEQPVFYVRDNGIGIDPRYQEKIFGLFDRLDQRVDGTGIGLALVRRIVEVHGGSIWVESEGVGRGSAFCFTLAPAPTAIEDRDLSSPPASPPPDGSGSGRGNGGRHLRTASPGGRRSGGIGSSARRSR